MRSGLEPPEQRSRPDIKTRIQVYGERVWSWHGNALGRGLYALVRRSGLVYELRFTDDLTCAVITRIVSVHGKRVRIPESLVRFTMSFVREGLWLRESRFFGLFHHVYDLRRVVRADGSREAAYAEYTRSAPARSFLAVRRRELPAQNSAGSL